LYRFLYRYGNYYALAITERLGVEESGGMVLQHSSRGGSVVE
jgi:hypothetical protein